MKYHGVSTDAEGAVFPVTDIFGPSFIIGNGVLVTNNDHTVVTELRRSLSVSLFLSIYEWYKNESESLPTNVSHCVKQVIFYIFS